MKESTSTATAGSSPRLPGLITTAVLILVGGAFFYGLIFNTAVMISTIMFVLGYGGCQYVLIQVKHLEKNRRFNRALGMRARGVIMYALVIDVIALFALLGGGAEVRYAVVITGWFAVGVIMFGIQQWYARRSYLHR